MFSFMDNVKKVVSNVQDLAVNVMNELDEGRGSEESPHPSANISPSLDGPLEKLKKDASAASEMIHNAANLLGEDEVFISLLTKLIKHCVSSEKNEEKLKLFQEWAVIHDFEFSLNHSSKTLQRLNELAVEINNSIERKPLSNLVDDSWNHDFDEPSKEADLKVERLERDLSEKSELIKKFKQRLLEDGKQLKAVNAELAEKTEEIMAFKDQSELLAALQLRIKDLEMENDRLQEDTQRVIEQQREKIVQYESSVERYAEELKELEEKLASSQLENCQQQTLSLESRSNENRLLELSTYEENLNQKTAKLIEIQNQVDELVKYQNELHEKLNKALFECESYKNEVVQLTGDKENLAAEYEAEKENTQNLKETLKEEVLQSESVHNELTKKCQQYLELEKSYSLISAQLEAVNNTAVQQGESSENHRLELSKAEDHLNQKSKELVEAQNQIDELTKSQNELHDKLNNALIECDALQKELLQLAQEKEEIMAFKDQSELLAALQLRIKDLEMENDRLQEDTQRVIEQQREKIVQYESSVERYAEELKELEEKLASSQFENCQQQTLSLESRSNENHRLELSKAEDDVKQKSLKLVEVQNQVDELMKSRNELHDKLNKALFEWESCKNELVQLTGDKENLAAEYEAEKENSLNLKETLKEEVLQSESVHNELTKKCQQYLELEKSYSLISAQLEAFNNSAVHQGESNENHRLELSKAEDHLNQKSKELVEAQNQIDELVKYQNELHEKLNKALFECESCKNELVQLTGDKENLAAEYEAEKENSRNLREVLKAEALKSEYVNNELTEKCQQYLELEKSYSLISAQLEAFNNSAMQKDQSNENHSLELSKAEDDVKQKSLKLVEVQNQVDELIKSQNELHDKLNNALIECDARKKELLQLAQEKEEFVRMNHMNVEELTSKAESLGEEVQRLYSELKISHESQTKLQNHIQKLTDVLQTKDDEVSQLAAEMENRAVDGPRAINTVKEMLQTKIKECNMYAEKNEHYKRNISQYTQQLQEKEHVILDLQTQRDNLLLQTQHLEEEFRRCHGMLEKLTAQSSQSDAATVKKLQDELSLMVNQYNIVKQVCFKMFIDEDRGFDHCMLLINLLNYDEKSKDILKEFVTAKYQGSIESFFKKFNFTSTAHLAQELLKFVDQDIAKSKIALAPVTEPAFQMKVDEALLESPSDSNDLRNIIQ